VTAPGSGPDADHGQSQGTRLHKCRRDFKAETILRARLIVPIGSDGDERTPYWVRFALRRGRGGR